MFNNQGFNIISSSCDYDLCHNCLARHFPVCVLKWTTSHPVIQTIRKQRRSNVAQFLKNTVFKKKKLFLLALLIRELLHCFYDIIYQNENSQPRSSIFISLHPV